MNELIKKLSIEQGVTTFEVELIMNEIIKKLSIKQGDITTFEVDAIVNAAHPLLGLGSGVNGAIHKVAGPELLEECEKLGGCYVGSSKLTKAYNLPSKYVIHAVGPIWRGGSQDEHKKLAGAYSTSLDLAHQYKCKSIVFPCISTGIFGMPLGEGCAIAVKTVTEWLIKNKEASVENVI